MRRQDGDTAQDNFCVTWTPRKVRIKMEGSTFQFHGSDAILRRPGIVHVPEGREHLSADDRGRKYRGMRRLYPQRCSHDQP